MRRRRPNVAVAALLLDLALDRAPEQVEDLGDDDHRGDPVLAEASKITRGLRLRT